jgi:hypothetical protein
MDVPKVLLLDTHVIDAMNDDAELRLAVDTAVDCGPPSFIVTHVEIDEMLNTIARLSVGYSSLPTTAPAIRRR